MFVSPTVVGSLVYAASCSGTLYAYDRAAGSIEWSYRTGFSFHGEPVVTESLLVIPVDDGSIYAFELETGEVVWNTPVPPAGAPPDLMLVGELVLGQSPAGEPFALDVSSGNPRWLGVEGESFGGDGTRINPPAAAADRFFFSVPGGVVFAVEAGNGKLVWRRALGERVTTALALRGDRLLAGTLGERLLWLDVATGEVVRETELEGQPYGAIVVAPGRSSDDPDRLIVTTSAGLLMALDADLGTRLWSVPTEREWSTFRPLVDGDTVVSGTAGGELVSLRLGDGGVAWRAELEGVLRGLGKAGDTYFVGTLDGAVYAWRNPAGARP